MKNRVLSYEELSQLCQKLYLLLRSGVLSADALAILAEDTDGPALSDALQQMADAVNEGAALTDAFRSSGLFPAWLCGLLAVGERTGRTEEALAALTEHTAQRAALERRLQSAFVYPCVLFLVMLTVTALLLVYVLPVFNDVYASLGGSLTGVAGALLSLGQALERVMPLLCVLLGLAVALLAAFTLLPAFRTALLLRWEKGGAKGVRGRLNTARAAQCLAMAMQSGMTVEEALELAEATLQPGSPIALSCRACRGELLKGEKTEQAFVRAGLLPKGEARLLSVGLRTGSADAAMAQIAERLTHSGNEALENAVGCIEPLMVTLSSLLVGVILLSVMLPLINIMSTIG